MESGVIVNTQVREPSGGEWEESWEQIQIRNMMSVYFSFFFKFYIILNHLAAPLEVC